MGGWRGSIVLAGRGWLIGRRCRGVSRGGCLWRRSGRSWRCVSGRRTGPRRIAVITGRPASTVGTGLRRWGCSRLPRPERDPIRRYERDRPGELLHVDTKKLGRFHVVGKRVLKDGVHRNRAAGWQHLHVAIDDHSRLAYTEVLAGQDRAACAAFLRRAVAWYADQGITIERVLSDNAKA